MLLRSQDLENCQQMRRARRVCRERGVSKPGRIRETVPLEERGFQTYRAELEGPSLLSFLSFFSSLASSRKRGHMFEVFGVYLCMILVFRDVSSALFAQACDIER